MDIALFSPSSLFADEDGCSTDEERTEAQQSFVERRRQFPGMGQNGSHFEPKPVLLPLPNKCDWEIDPSELDFSNSVTIGKGSFGEILKAGWRGTPVAVKRILPNLSDDKLVINIVDVSSYDELKEAILQGKWARGPWSASDKEELKVKEETGATIRCFPFEQQPQVTHTCLMTGNPADEVAIFAKSY